MADGGNIGARRKPPSDSPNLKLQERDYRALWALFLHGYMSDSQLRLWLGEVWPRRHDDGWAKRLRKLYDARLLRIPKSLRSRGVQTEESIYALANVGASILDAQNPALGIAARDWSEPDSRAVRQSSIRHQLGVVDVMLWIQLGFERLGIVTYFPGHFSRERYRLQPPGVQNNNGQPLRLQPDQVLAVARPDGKRIFIALEFSNNDRKDKRLAEKLSHYHAWWRHWRASVSGLERKERWARDIKNLLVLTVARERAALERVRKHAAHIGRTEVSTHSWSYLRFTPHESIELVRPETVLSPIFLQADNPSPVTLVPAHFMPEAPSELASRWSRRAGMPYPKALGYEPFSMPENPVRRARSRSK